MQVSMMVRGKRVVEKEDRKQMPEEKRAYNFNGYALFTEEFHEERKAKGKQKKGEKVEKTGQQVREAWRRLSKEKKDEYSRRAQQLRLPGIGSKYVVPFLTRCAPTKFIKICENLKGRNDCMERLKNIGFDKVVNVCCRRIPRDLCMSFMQGFNLQRKEVSIRGHTRRIGEEDFHELMGLPNGGNEIDIHEKHKENVFFTLCQLYKGVSYEEIGDWLKREMDENFELYFVLYALGTFLDPSATIYVSDRVLRLLTVTKDAFGHFNWCLFLFNELCDSIGRLKRKLKHGKGEEKKTVGGCLYFLMLFGLQHFPLNNLKAENDHDAISFWDDKMVKKRLMLEKQSASGLLRGDKGEVGHGCTMCTYEKRLKNPEIRATFSKLVTKLGEELLALENRLNNEGHEDDHLENEDRHEEEEVEGSSKNSENDVEEEDDEEDARKETADLESIRDDEEQDAVEIECAEGKNDESDNENLHLATRRSMREKAASWVKKSPWIELDKRRGKRKMVDRDVLFEFCTSSETDVDRAKEMIVMHDYFLTKRELECLQPRAWINNSLILMVAKTLVADQKQKNGQVSRHIFTADFMDKIVANPMKWSPSTMESQFLPQHLQYNIGDCEFIFGPAVSDGHWCCYVVEPKSMRFYVLDSLVDSWTYYRMGAQTSKKNKKKKKKRGELDGKEILARGVRDCFVKMLRIVKPELFSQVDNVCKQIIWPKVHVQKDTHSCGVHVLTWLQMWDGKEQDSEGYTMPPYTFEQLMQIKVGLLWWLLTHDHNEKRDEVLCLVSGSSNSKRSK